MSTLIRHETTDNLPPVRECCWHRHPLPFQHVTVYQDKRTGRTKHQHECPGCFPTLQERGLRPANIRWLPKGAQPGALCETCTAERNARLAAQAEAQTPEQARLIADEVFAGIKRANARFAPKGWS